MSSRPKKPKLLAIVGPTASGKTALGIALAKRFGGEIVSADSRQIYRGMDIGTAKAPIVFRLRDPATPNEPGYVEGIPHYLVDIKDPDEEYSVADFKRDANAAIDEILINEKLPILVGGTGLYVRSIVENLDIPEIKADPKLRAKIEKEIEKEGLDAVFKKLVALDPEAVYVVDPKNPRRVVRALEVATITGKPFTEQRQKHEPLYDILEIGITSSSAEVLRERIDRRVDEMIYDGLVDEVQSLMNQYGAKTGKKIPVAFDAIGYREIIDALVGRCSMDAAIATMKLNTWHFAKRQLTWFKKDKKIHWVKDELDAFELVRKFLTGTD
jgi:tRNA dimethylallyltransferase